MDKRNEHLPADSDAKKSKEDTQYQTQEEFDDNSRQSLDDQSRNQDRVRNESQTKREDMVQPEKKKQSEKQDKVDRKLPNLKK